MASSSSRAARAEAVKVGDKIDLEGDYVRFDGSSGSRSRSTPSSARAPYRRRSRSRRLQHHGRRKLRHALRSRPRSRSRSRTPTATPARGDFDEFVVTGDIRIDDFVLDTLGNDDPVGTKSRRWSASATGRTETERSIRARWKTFRRSPDLLRVRALRQAIERSAALPAGVKDVIHHRERRGAEEVGDLEWGFRLLLFDISTAAIGLCVSSFQAIKAIRGEDHHRVPEAGDVRGDAVSGGISISFPGVTVGGGPHADSLFRPRQPVEPVRPRVRSTHHQASPTRRVVNASRVTSRG